MGEVCVKKDGKGGRQKNKFRHGFFALLKGTPRINAVLLCLAYTLLYIVSSGFLGSVFSQSIEKKRVKTLVG